MENIKTIILPIIGEEFEINGHLFQVIEVKRRRVNANYIAVCQAQSALMDVTITMSSNLSLFKLDK